MINTTQKKYLKKGLTIRGTKRKYSEFISTNEIKHLAINDMREELGKGKLGKINLSKSCIHLVSINPKIFKKYLKQIIIIQIP